MNARLLKSSAVVLMMLTVGSVFAACSPQNFTAADTPAIATGTTTPGATGGTTCTATNVAAITTPTKILFVVDTSGSNAAATSYPASSSCNNGYNECIIPASDPQKSFRGGAITNFLNTYKAKTNFYWGFETFADSTAHALVNGGSDQSPTFAKDPNSMQLALNSFYYIKDYGQTPYRSAIDLAARTIVNDPDLRATTKTNYFVILLTDGFPTDYYDNAGQFRSAAINSDIDSLISIAPGQISLSTIYYGQTNDPSAIGLLKSIASKGGGQFASVNDPNSGFKIDDVIPGSSTGCAAKAQ